MQNLRFHVLMAYWGVFSHGDHESGHRKSIQLSSIFPENFDIAVRENRLGDLQVFIEEIIFILFQKLDELSLGTKKRRTENRNEIILLLLLLFSEF